MISCLFLAQCTSEMCQVAAFLLLETANDAYLRLQLKNETNITHYILKLPAQLSTFHSFTIFFYHKKNNKTLHRCFANCKSFQIHLFMCIKIFNYIRSTLKPKSLDTTVQHCLPVGMRRTFHQFCCFRVYSIIRVWIRQQLLENKNICKDYTQETTPIYITRKLNTFYQLQTSQLNYYFAHNTKIVLLYL